MVKEMKTFMSLSIHSFTPIFFFFFGRVFPSMNQRPLLCQFHLFLKVSLNFGGLPLWLSW